MKVQEGKDRRFWFGPEFYQMVRNEIEKTRLGRHIKLHPGVPNLMQTLLNSDDYEKRQDTIFKSKQASNFAFELDKLARKYLDLVRSRFETQENEILTKSLKICQSSALMLTESKCLEIGRKLRNAGHTNVSLGEESFFNVSMGFVLKGAVGPYLIMRLKSLDTAGLWNWWQDFIRGKDEISSFNSENKGGFEKPTMSGNIVVIFSLFVFGLLFSILVFMLQLCGIKILKWNGLIQKHILQYFEFWCSKVRLWSKLSFSTRCRCIFKLL